MKINVKALAVASAILWGLAMLGMGLANLIWGGYGQQFLQTMASVYFGYHATRSIAGVIVGTSTERWMVWSLALSLLGSTISLLSPSV